MTVGLPNNNGSCFFNSLVQCLMHISIFVTQCKHKNTSPEFRNMYKLFQSYILCSVSADVLKAGYDAIVNNINSITAMSQNDVSEAFSSFIKLCEKEHNFLNLFQFRVNFKTTCDTCLEYSIKSEPYTSIPLTLGNLRGTVELNDLLRQHVLEEKIQDYKCSLCSIRGSCTRTQTYDSMPDVLVIHISRKIYNLHTNEYSKSFMEVSFSQDLQFNSTHYKLVSYSEHYGNATQGHYVSVVKSGKNFKLCDDQQIKKYTIGNKKIISKHVCLIFFEKNKLCCPYCEKTLRHMSSLSRHKKICNKNINQQHTAAATNAYEYSNTECENINLENSGGDVEIQEIGGEFENIVDEHKEKDKKKVYDFNLSENDNAFDSSSQADSQNDSTNGDQESPDLDNFFPFPNIETALLFFWANTTPRISKRKLQQLLDILHFTNFKVQNVPKTVHMLKKYKLQLPSFKLGKIVNFLFF